MTHQDVSNVVGSCICIARYVVRRPNDKGHCLAAEKLLFPLCIGNTGILVRLSKPNNGLKIIYFHLISHTQRRSLVERNITIETDNSYVPNKVMAQITGMPSKYSSNFGRAMGTVKAIQTTRPEGFASIPHV